MSRLLKLLTIFSMLVLPGLVFAQTDIEKAKNLGNQAVVLEDKSDFDGALKLLADAEKLDPASSVYPYETAYSYYGLKQYQQAIDILSGLVKRTDAFAREYQLLGNSYDDLGQTDKAVETYNAGLQLFPNSGELYLESAVIQIGKKDYEKALAYCEKGIKAAPAFPSNYYWAARIFCGSSEKVWGIMYGEIFVNLERNTKRTAEISKLLYTTYQSSLHISSPTKKSVDFSKAEIVLDSKADVKNFKPPFKLTYPLVFLMAVGADTAVNLASLDMMRQRFIVNYWGHYTKDYPNVLFDYQQKVASAGQMEGYNYWLLSQGDAVAFNKWQKAYSVKWNAFFAWFNANPIKIDDSNKFYREQY